MKKEIKAIRRFLIIFLFITLSAYADFRFQVRIVQFQPTDAPPENVDILEFVKDAQEFYRDEMQRHGYGPKTFRVEKFAGIRVHFVNGKHPIEHYTTGTLEKVTQELPAELQRLNNIYIVMINGLPGIGNDRFTPGVARDISCGASGGDLLLAADNPDLDFRVLVHELGHTFGIMHNISDPKSIMQGRLRLVEGQGGLSDLTKSGV